MSERSCSESLSRPCCHSRSKFAAISASMMVLCQLQASAAEANSSISSTRPPSAPASSANASRVPASTFSQCGVFTNASMGSMGGSSEEII